MPNSFYRLVESCYVSAVLCVLVATVDVEPQASRERSCLSFLKYTLRDYEGMVLMLECFVSLY